MIKNRKKISGKSIREKNIAKFATKAASFAIQKAKNHGVPIVFSKEGRNTPMAASDLAKSFQKDKNRIIILPSK